MSPIQDLNEDINKLASNARRVKRAHFIAAERKKITHNVVGVFLIVINLLITSSLIEALFRPDQTDIIIKVLAFIAAVLAGIQTFFNFEKNVQSHLTAGRTYATLQHQTELLLASTKKTDVSEEVIWDEYKKLSDAYLQANADFEAFVPSNRDYDKARAELKKQAAAT
jgi:uncharacterized protein (DUF952 family)